jgi:hypothetical protein
LPQVIFVEPTYQDSPHTGRSTDDHAPAGISDGQQFLMEVYKTVTANSAFWKSALLIVDYDEHGGFFDHVSPPLIPTNPPGGAEWSAPFKSLGVRTPAFIISPFVSPGAVSHNLLDHTSVLKLLGEKFGTGSYSPDVDSRPVSSISHVLDFTNPILQAPAAPSLDDYLKLRPPAPVGVTMPPGNTVMQIGFRNVIRSMKQHGADGNHPRFGQLLGSATSHSKIGNFNRPISPRIPDTPISPRDPDSHDNPIVEFEQKEAATIPYHKTYSAFIPDRDAYGCREVDKPLNDALGVGEYAGHLAQLIAAKETWMPLSIGLFGAWGAGKSHFIDLLDEHLRALTLHPGKVFHQQIVQIRFNAWHYLDTNLWANLVCEIFDQLFVKLEERRDTTTAQVEKLKSELAKQSALAAEAKEALKTAETARVEAEAKLRTAIKERVAEERKLSALLDDLKNLLIDENVREQLRAAADGLGLPKLQSSFVELETRAGEVRSLTGRTKALMLAMFTGTSWRKRILLLAAAIVAPISVAWLADHGTVAIQDLLAGAGRTIVQVITAITVFSAWISLQIKTGNALVGKLESAYDSVKAVRSKREDMDDAAQAQKALGAKRQTEEEARHTLHKAEEQMKALHS